MSNLKTHETAAPKDEFTTKNIRSGSQIIPSGQARPGQQTDKSPTQSPYQSVNLPFTP
ncbi:hypothetical protein [uncultured Campylobacter sp.]|uniref:hypothetical protein n=1 Tax=uncultured Campylobacter sp. TaxID=218934 RepID=UPI00263760D7|nr:hypothetical protein [uncultured Campylobacter sp.]